MLSRIALLFIALGLISSMGALAPVSPVDHPSEETLGLEAVLDWAEETVAIDVKGPAFGEAVLRVLSVPPAGVSGSAVTPTYVEVVINFDAAGSWTSTQDLRPFFALPDHDVYFQVAESGPTVSDTAQYTEPFLMRVRHFADGQVGAPTAVGGGVQQVLGSQGEVHDVSWAVLQQQIGSQLSWMTVSCRQRGVEGVIPVN